MRDLAFSKGDSVLGRQCGSVANFTKETSPTASGVPCFVKGTTAKVANLPQSLQSSHSPTATPRILEEDDRTLCEKSTASVKVDSSDEAFLSSLRADLSAWQSIQKSTTALESTFLRHAAQAQKIQKLQKVDSRIFHNTAIFAAAKTMDSKETSANAERYPLFCHATATQCLAMTEKHTANKKVDSRENAQGLKTPQAAGFLKEYQQCPSDSKISRLESGFLLKKPAAASPCTASLFFKPRKEIRLGCLSTKRGDEIHDSSPKAESKNLKG